MPVERQLIFSLSRGYMPPDGTLAHRLLVACSIDDALHLALLAFAIGTGAWMGSMLGTYLHARRRK